MSLASDPALPDLARPVDRSGRAPRLAARVDGVRRLARRRPRLTVVVVVVVAVLVGVGVRAWVTRDPGTPGWARSPHSAVQGYLDAVADGRAADALAYMYRPPADRTLLTDAVLTRSRELAPMTEIVLGTSSSSTVGVEYRLGDQKTKAWLEVREDDGYWFVDLQPGLVRFTGFGDLDGIGDYGVTVLVNGTPLVPGTDMLPLFPGRYHVTSDNPLVDVDTTFTVAPTAEARKYANRGDVEVQLRPKLTDDGRQRVAQAAQDQLDTCLAQTGFNIGCGFVDRHGLPESADPATIAWTLTGDTAMPLPDAALVRSTALTQWYGAVDPHRLFVVVPVEIQPRCTWTTVTGQAEEWKPVPVPNHYVADITDPDRISIAFVFVQG